MTDQKKPRGRKPAEPKAPPTPEGRRLEIVYRDPATLTPDPRNARTHSPEQIEQLRASIREFGFTNPVLLRPNGMIGAGHGRVEAAKAEGLASVPTCVVEGLTDEQWRAYVIADNKLALNAGWDADLLRAELAALTELEIDLSSLGFNDGELADLFKTTQGATDPDDTPDPPTVPVSNLGDVWLLGDHRIRCGDSTDAEGVVALLAGAKPHLMVTDPPYGVAYDADWRNKAIRSDGSPIAGRAIGVVLNDDQADWSKAWALFHGDVAYVWHAGNMAHTVADSLISNGLFIRAQIIWNKSSLVIGRGDYHPKHEPCWYAVRKGKKGHFVGGRKQTTVWDIDKPQKSETGHSTQKPVECMKRPIENNSQPGDAVYEPFSGSGTTIIAAEVTGRRCYAMELFPAYVDVAVIRWEQFTGRTATLEATGQTFRQVAEERGQKEVA